MSRRIVADLFSLDGFSLAGLPTVPSLVVCFALGGYMFTGIWEQLPKPPVDCVAERAALQARQAALGLSWDALRAGPEMQALEACLDAARDQRVPGS